MKSRKTNYVFVYYKSAFNQNGFAHPEIRIFELNKYDDEKAPRMLGEEILTITGQMDKGRSYPYGIKVSFSIKNFEQAKPFLSAIEKEKKKRGWRGIIKALNKKKITRYITTRWPEVSSKELRSMNDCRWVPFKYRKKADAYVSAVESGLKIT